MEKLTDFQEIVGMALDISDNQAAKIQRRWPDSERDLRRALRQWKNSSGSNVSGTDLLAICREIWRQKPVGDLALTEGREILYHPQTGAAISEYSPLNKIPLETLAFLRWSIQAGYLQWIDEVTIVREVNKVGGIITNLPGDRFYAKNLLPRTDDGVIDWSDIALAKAKAFVQGKMESSTFDASSRIYFDEDTLEGFLATIPALVDEANRNMLLRNMPAGPVGAISRSSAYATDIAQIVEAVQGFGKLATGQMAVNVLIDNAMRFVRGSQKELQLEKFRLM